MVVTYSLVYCNLIMINTSILVIIKIDVDWKIETSLAMDSLQMYKLVHN